MSSQWLVRSEARGGSRLLAVIRHPKLPSALRSFVKRGIGHVSLPISSLPMFDRPSGNWSIALTRDSGSAPFDERDVESELRRGYLGTARRKGRQQTNQTYDHRATSRLYRTRTDRCDAAIDGSRAGYVELVTCPTRL
jgi:hypothetical protein